MIEIMKRMKKTDWLLLGLALIFIVFGVWMDLNIPERFGAVTSLITGQVENATLGDVWHEGMWMLIYTVGSALAMVVVAFCGAKVSTSHAKTLRKDVYEKVGDFAVSDVKRFSIASLITRATGDVDAVRMFINMAILMMIRVPILTIWALFRISQTRVELVLILVTALTLIVLMALFIVIVAVPRFKRIRENTDKLNLVARENLTGMRVVRAYNAQKFHQTKYDDVNQKLGKDNLFVAYVTGVLFPYITLIFSGISVAIFWVLSIILNDDWTVLLRDPYLMQNAMAFMQYAFMIVSAILMLIFTLTMLPSTIVSVKRIKEILKTKPMINDKTDEYIGLKEKFDHNGTIVFDNVEFIYPGAKDYVLKDINLTINKGEVAAFIGSTGCGKSSLINLIPKIAFPTSGKVLIGGQDLKYVKLEEINDLVGHVTQIAQLFSGTIEENIAFGDVDGQVADDASIEKALTVAQAWDFVDELDDKLDSIVVQRGKNFSGGQKQRLSIARILARNPEVILFDDTFSALDYKTDLALRSAIKSEYLDMTMLIVAQRIGTIRNADCIYVMDKGRIVGSGKHQDLIRTCLVYQEIAKSQLSDDEYAKEVA